MFPKLLSGLERRARVAVFLAALLPRLILPAIGFDGVAPDSTENIAMARGLVEGRGMTDANGRLTAIRPPTYPLILTGIYRIFGVEQRPVQIVQAAVGALVAAALLELLTPLLGRRRAMIAGFVHAFDPVAIPGTAFVLTETFGAALLLLAISAFLRLDRRPSRSAHAWFGLLSGALLYQTMITLLLAPFAFAARILRAPRLAPRLLLAVLVFLLPMALWTARNKVVLGEGTAVRSHGFGFLLWGTLNYDFDWLPSPYDPDSDYIFKHRDRVFRHYSLVEEHSVYMKKGIRRFETEPVSSVIRMSKAIFWASFEIPGAMKSLDDWPVARTLLRLANVAVLAGAVFGALSAARIREGRVLLFVVLYFVIFLAPLFPIPRYFLPVRPIFAALVAFAAYAPRRFPEEKNACAA